MFVSETSAPREVCATLIARPTLEVVAFEQDAETPLVLDAPAIGSCSSLLVHEDDRAAFTQVCTLASANGLRATLRVRISKGYEWWIVAFAEISSMPGADVRIVLTLDVRSNANDAIRRLRDLVDGAMHGAAVIADNEPIFVNEGLATMLGYEDLDEFIASGNIHLINNLHPDDLGVVIERVAARLRGEEESACYEVRFRKKDGSYIWVEITGKLGVWDGRKVSISWIGNIDARKRAEAALIDSRRHAQAANDAKSAFLASMSHEIRTPLNGILGMAQVLAMSNLSPAQREYADTIKESGMSLLALLNDVLDISKIEAGKVDINAAPNDLRHELGRIQKLFAPTAAAKDLSLELTLDPSLPDTLSFDPLRVRQCVSNLVSNAIKFTSDGRVDIIAGWRADANDASIVEIAVRDTGLGVSQDDQKRLFTAFEQVDSSAKRSAGGTGLGLAISRKLARLMGGDICLDSELGRGSTFTLTFRVPETARPAHEDASAMAHGAKAAAAGPLSGLSVLVVDDNVVNRQVATLLLGALGVTVLTAEHGRAALDVLEQNNVHCVLLDMQMPVMDGPTTLAHIRAAETAWRDVPVIAMTADAMAKDRDRYLAMGMTGYIAKPITTGELQRELSAALGAVPAQRRAAG